MKPLPLHTLRRHLHRAYTRLHDHPTYADVLLLLDTDDEYQQNLRTAHTLQRERFPVLVWTHDDLTLTYYCSPYHHTFEYHLRIARYDYRTHFTNTTHLHSLDDLALHDYTTRFYQHYHRQEYLPLTKTLHKSLTGTSRLPLPPTLP